MNSSSTVSTDIVIAAVVDELARDFLSLTETLTMESRFATQVPSTTVADEFSRFKLWAGNIAAHRKGRRSLEYRLRDAAHLKNETHRLLGALSDALKNALSITNGEKVPWDELSNTDSESEESDEGSLDAGMQGNTELNQLVASVRVIITSLFRLSMAIRNPAPNSQSTRSITADKSVYEQHDIRHVKEKFPKSPYYLTERLGRALSARRQYLSYREEHHQKLTRNIEKLGFEKPSTEFTVNSTEATPIPGIQRTMSLNLVDEEDEVASQTSYATSINAAIKIPRLPKVARNKDFFECPLCFLLVSIHSAFAWKQHVYRDLHPYCCTHEQCTIADRLYDSRKDWFAHELEAHWTVWQCVEGCCEVFKLEADFERHVQKSHAELASASMMSALKRTSTKVCDLGGEASCALCGETMTLRALQRHLGSHQQQLALFALPTNLGDAEDDTNDRDAGSMSSGSHNEEEISDISKMPDSEEIGRNRKLDVENINVEHMSLIQDIRSEWEGYLERECERFIESPPEDSARREAKYLELRSLIDQQVLKRLPSGSIDVWPYGDQVTKLNVSAVLAKERMRIAIEPQVEADKLYVEKEKDRAAAGEEKHQRGDGERIEQEVQERVEKLAKIDMHWNDTGRTRSGSGFGLPLPRLGDRLGGWPSSSGSSNKASETPWDADKRKDAFEGPIGEQPAVDDPWDVVAPTAKFKKKGKKGLFINDDGPLPAPEPQYMEEDDPWSFSFGNEKDNKKGKPEPLTANFNTKRPSALRRGSTHMTPAQSAEQRRLLAAEERHMQSEREATEACRVRARREGTRLGKDLDSPQHEPSWVAKQRGDDPMPLQMHLPPQNIPPIDGIDELDAQEELGGHRVDESRPSIRDGNREIIVQIGSKNDRRKKYSVRTDPSPTYTRRSAYAQGPAIIRPSAPRPPVSRLRVSATRQLRPVGYSGEPGPHYRVQQKRPLAAKRSRIESEREVTEEHGREKEAKAYRQQHESLAYYDPRGGESVEASDGSREGDVKADHHIVLSPSSVRAKNFEDRFRLEQQAERELERQSRYYKPPRLSDSEGEEEESEEEDAGDEEEEVELLPAPAPSRSRRPADNNRYQAKRQANQRLKRQSRTTIVHHHPPPKPFISESEKEVSEGDEEDVKADPHIVPSTENYLKRSAKQSQLNRTAVTSNRNDEIRLRVDASAPLSLAFNGDKGGRTLRMVPVENGIADTIIGGPRSREEESTHQGSERGSERGALVITEPRRHSDEILKDSPRSLFSTRDERLVQVAQTERVEQGRPLRRRPATAYRDYEPPGI